MLFIDFDMERRELNLNKGCEGGVDGGGGGGGRSDGFIDRSKVRILLCDSDADSSKEVFTLLLKCSYQGIYIYTHTHIPIATLFLLLLLNFYCVFVSA